MSIFCVKQINPQDQELFDLKKIREDKGLTLADLEKLTHIPSKYLLAIEDYHASALPEALAYRQAYLRSYATALDIDYNRLNKIFSHQNGLAKKCSWQKIKSPNNASPYFILRNLGLVALILLFCGYIGWQINGIFAPPKLVIYSPPEGFISNHASLLVQGEATKESSLTINGQNIMINEQGEFTANIDLSNGVNTIAITAIKKHGESTTLVRHVVREDKTIQINKN